MVFNTHTHTHTRIHTHTHTVRTMGTVLILKTEDWPITLLSLEWTEVTNL